MEILPVAKIKRTIKNRLSSVMPEVYYMLGDVCGTLDALVIDAGQVTSLNYHTVKRGDAEKILAEAFAVAEQKIKDSFHSLPSTCLFKSGLDLHR
jgi:division protein CdvB (Snf7/Vps24/ESCRT-III family)